MNAREGELTHLSSTRYKSFLCSTQASAVILVKEYAANCPVNALVVDNPILCYARASHLFHRRVPELLGINDRTEIHPSATIGDNVRIGPFVCIGPEVHIGTGVEIGANTTIRARSTIGSDSCVQSNVSIYEDVHIGERCVVHSNVVIGADGFGFVPTDSGEIASINQLGGVQIGNDVVVGASSTIDCGAIDDTIIEDGVKLDDQVHIGHNCIVGAHSMLCGCTGLGGSVTIGPHCVLAGGVGVAGTGPLNIASGVQVGAMTYVSRSIDKPGMYQGASLHMPIAEWKRNAIRTLELDELVKRVSKLERSAATKEES